MTKRSRIGLVERKLLPPPLPDPLLSRPRLAHLLASLIERHRVVIVSATAGSGKTIAVSEASRLVVDRLLAWLSVDRTDVAPGRLVTYLEAAFARQLPDIAGIASEALAAGIPHPEVAGLLAEAVGNAPILLVLDDLERLGTTPEAWAVIEGLLRYAPPSVRVVLVSRHEIPATLCTLPTGWQTAALTEHDLTFTPAEAAGALGMLGEANADAGAVVEATGGWVTGVLFEAWRSAGHIAGLGGEADPLDGYLSSQILDQLEPGDREFLVTTSVLDEVTVARAAALGQPSASEHLAALRAVHLPVVWVQRDRAMRCHPRFREYLLKRLERRDPRAIAEIRVAHGLLLASEGHSEEATEELLRAGAPEMAAQPASQAIFGVIERLDLDVAEGWLAEIGPTAAPGLPLAELMLALVRDDYSRGMRVADVLADLGEREELARTSDDAAALMAAFYLAGGRLADVDAVLHDAGDGPGTNVVRYMLRLYGEGRGHPRPDPSGGPMDGVLMYADYFFGRLTDLAQAPESRWAHAVARPWQIAARCAVGHSDEALELFETARDVGVMPVSLGSYVGPEVVIDAGSREEARDVIVRGRALARASGARDLELLNGLVEARLELRLERDAAAGHAVLDRLEREPGARDWPLISGPLNAWRGFAFLLASDDRAAVTHLRRAVEIMRAGELWLDLPTAAAYLAEAEWRVGEEDAADAAVNLALEASHHLGSNNRLLQALADFPAVVSRRIDAERGADSRWHELGRALIVQYGADAAPMGNTVELREFGRLGLVVDGVERRPRITKSYELLAYLIAHDRGLVGRDTLLDALFDGRSDASSRSYLRQAIYWVRRALPPGGLIADRGSVRLGDGVATSESTRFEALLSEATRLGGDAQLATLKKALALFDQGEYFAGTRSTWADVRCQALAARAIDARGQVAVYSFEAGRYREAGETVREVLRADPLREAAWRLTMRIANALGDDDGVIAAFRACEQALVQVGTTPSPSTHQLLEQLRR